MKIFPSRDYPVPTYAAPDDDSPDEREVTLDCPIGCLSGAIPGPASGLLRRGLSSRSEASTAISVGDAAGLYRRGDLAEIPGPLPRRIAGIDRGLFVAGLITRRTRSKRHRAKTAPAARSQRADRHLRGSKK